MGARFDYFVVFAGMRTGSNFLEETINDYPGLECLGELFNPHFVGHAGRSESHGISMAQREEDPMQLLAAIRQESAGLPGFRFFHDHDPRILAHVLPDRRCAKIILTRNPVESYVSQKIAEKTGQWRLGDMTGSRVAKADFDEAEFAAHLEQVQAFQMALLRGLQVSGQTAYYVGYDDLRDLDVMDGLARFLGVEHQKKRETKATKVQNPQALDEKVSNYGEMEAALSKLDRFDLSRTPNFEPQRTPVVPTYVAAAEAPLLYQPIPCGPEPRILPWLAALDGVEVEKLKTGFFQKALRQWKRQHKGHRAFTVVRHPVMRLHVAFSRHILPAEGAEVYSEIRATLRKQYKIPIPAGTPGTDWTAELHRVAFVDFARFVAGNLNGQTSLRVDGSWASQEVILQGMAEVQLPDMILREDSLEQGLEQLADQVGLGDIPEPPPFVDPGRVPLAAYYDDEVEAAVRAAYQRDYMMFGFGQWAQPWGGEGPF
ncbi:nodulation protein NodH [Pseudoruegeria sp. HB172150]|uniref:nodulation protein NodH n=1 Tax=Pseudoruegeria sp. HB172150 TaxID=2721164 RepID=UPI0015571F54|nr:nodulation protein NodH [Pseudoruegeria sp. HB172150]